MASYGTNLLLMTKGTSIDLVTQVDRDSDALIMSTLREACPEITQFLTEESFQEDEVSDGVLRNLSDVWVVDPLDGTTNYAHSFPHFAVSIALFRENLPCLGVIYDPFKQELFHAVRNGGAFLNDKPIHTSRDRVQVLNKALLATGFPYDIASSSVNNIEHFKRIAPCCHGVRRPGAAALDLAYVACGRLDGFWELKLSVWDIAAGTLLVEEAGGRISALSGGPLSYQDRRIHLIGSNGTPLHEEIRNLLAQDP